MALDRVVDSAVLDGALSATANAIREKTGSTERIAWDEAKGFSDVIVDVYEAGKKAEYEARWNAIHDSIENFGCKNAFSGAPWTNDTFRPTRDIHTDSSYMMFRDSRIAGDLPAMLEEWGIQITFEPGIAMQYTFFGTKFTRLGVFDFSDCQHMNGCFSDSLELVTIDKIICNKNTKFTDAFDWLYALENIRFEGELANDGLNLQDCEKLSKASLESIVNVFSTTASFSATLSKAAVDKAFETSAGANDGSTSPEWLALKATRPNVTILLA